VPRILLVEDNKTNQIVALGTLKRVGYEVDVADDGAEAVRRHLAVHYDAIVMDVMMPDLDGYEATRQIRDLEAIHQMPRVPVVGLSARALPQDRAMALGAGMDEYLTKPLRVPALRAALERLVTRTLVEG
jgi:CheY-like chemotaxis protein